MSTFIERLQAEKAELDERVTKLGAFGDTAEFKALPSVMQELLSTQLVGMLIYQDALDQRIAILNHKGA